MPIVFDPTYKIRKDGPEKGLGQAITASADMNRDTLTAGERRSGSSSYHYIIPKIEHSKIETR